MHLMQGSSCISTEKSPLSKGSISHSHRQQSHLDLTNFDTPSLPRGLLSSAISGSPSDGQYKKLPLTGHLLRVLVTVITPYCYGVRKLALNAEEYINK